jgi:hypothetical protein
MSEGAKERRFEVGKLRRWKKTGLRATDFGSGNAEGGKNRTESNGIRKWECGRWKEKQGGVLINSMDRSPRFAEPPKANRKQNSSALFAPLR